MSTETEVNSEVKTVIQVLHDGHKGFTEIAEHLKDPAAKAFFTDEAVTRHKFEHELKVAAGVRRTLAGRQRVQCIAHGEI